MLPALLHIPTPGDHFSPRTGSAVMSVVDALSRRHAAAGGYSAVAVQRGTYTDHYESAAVFEYEPGGLLATPVQRLLEVAGGAVGRPRLRSAAAYKPAIAAVDRPGGILLIHNAPHAGWALPGDQQAVLYCHNTLFRTYTRREMHRLSDHWSHVIAVSEYVAADVVAHAPWLNDRTSVVMNGVDTETFQPDGHANDVPQVIFVGRVVPEKGPHLLVDALTRLTGYRAKIIGSAGFADLPLTPYERRLRDKAAGHPIDFLPFQPRARLPTLLAAADVLVVPSIMQEPFALALLEGMACGLACIAHAVGGMPSVLDGAGVLVDPAKRDHLVEVLAGVLGDPTWRRQLQGQARRRALALSWTGSHRALLDALSS